MTFSTLTRLAATAAAAVALMGAAHATPIEWTISSAVLSDGGVVTGSFTYDATTNVYSSINLLFGAGSQMSAFTYTDGMSDLGYNANGFGLGHLTAGNLIDRYMELHWDPALSDAGGTVNIRLNTSNFDGAYDCLNCSPFRTFVSGELTSGGTVPEPGTLALAGLMLAGLGLSRRKA